MRGLLAVFRGSLLLAAARSFETPECQNKSLSGREIYGKSYLSWSDFNECQAAVGATVENMGWLASRGCKPDASGRYAYGNTECYNAHCWCREFCVICMGAPGCNAVKKATNGRANIQCMRHGGATGGLLDFGLNTGECKDRVKVSGWLLGETEAPTEQPSAQPTKPPTSAPTFTTSTATTRTNTLKQQLDRVGTDVAKAQDIIEQQVQNTEAHVERLDARIGELAGTSETTDEGLGKKIEQLAAQLTSEIKRVRDDMQALRDAVVQLGEGGAGGAVERRCPEVDDGVVPAPAIETTDDGSSLDIQACGGKIRLVADECTVDPCNLDYRVSTLEKNLEALGELP